MLSDVVPDIVARLLRSKDKDQGDRKTRRRIFKGRRLRKMSFIKRIGSHRSKDASKFQFDVEVQKVVGLSPGSYCVRWTRGTRMVSTSSFEVNAQQGRSKGGTDVGEKLSLVCTLHRSSHDENKFDEKDCKLSIISLGKRNEKTTGKVHFDLSEFVGMPSATNERTFQLNANVSVKAKVVCTYARKSRGTASSVGSVVSRLTKKSSGSTNNPDQDLDLDITSPVTPQPGAEPFRSNPEEPVSPARSRNNESFQKKRVSRFALSSYKTKAKLANLEYENEKLENELRDLKTVIEKSKAENEVNENLIQELRQKQDEALSGTDRNRILRRVQEENHDLRRQAAVNDAEHVRKLMKAEEKLRNEQTRTAALRMSEKRLEQELRASQEELENLRNIDPPASDNQEVLKLRQEKDRYKKKYLRSQKVQEDTSKKLQEVTLENGRLQEKLQDREKDIKRLDSRIKVHVDHAAKTKETYDRLSQMYTDLRQSHIDKQTSLSKHGKNSYNNLETSLSTMKVSQKDMVNQIDRYNTQLMRLEKENSELNGKYHEAMVDLQESKSLYADAKNEADITRDQLDRLVTKKAEATRECTMYQADLEVAARVHQETCEKYETQLLELQRNNLHAEHYEKEMVKLKSEIDALTTKVQAQGSADNQLESEQDRDGLSSKNIRRMDVAQLLTDEQILNELIDTKMKLAFAEEQKLNLERLFHRVKSGNTLEQETGALRTEPSKTSITSVTSEECDPETDDDESLCDNTSSKATSLVAD